MERVRVLKEDPFIHLQALLFKDIIQYYVLQKAGVSSALLSCKKCMLPYPTSVCYRAARL